MRSMVEGATASNVPGHRPLHRVPRSPSPAPRGRNRLPAPRSWPDATGWAFRGRAADLARREAPTAEVAAIPLSPRFGWAWRGALLLAALTVAFFGFYLVQLVLTGLGVWGNNIPFVWGFDLINYVWWIGIANGASLFAAILVLRRHNLRTAVNRFAEGLALFSVICAGIFPIIHLGRPWLFYWVFPYPATYEVWPQFRSTLIWDFWAISAHAVVTTLLWYVGMIPDLATLRDRARRPWRKRIFGLFALGWRGSARHWVHHQTAYRTVAAIVLPLILVMQSAVAFEFAVTLVPAWHEARMPVHFVITGLASGLAAVLLIASAVSSGLGLQRIIEPREIELMAKLLLANILGCAYLYFDEILFALLADPVVRTGTIARMVGDYALVFWAAVVLTALVPQVLWSRAMRRSPAATILVATSVIAGVWLDRFSIVVAGVARDYLPSMWRTYEPTFAEWALLIGTLGLFAALMLLFVRYLPVVSMFETRHDEHEERA